MRLIPLLLILFLTACSGSVAPTEQATPLPPTLPFATATLVSTITPRPSATLAPPTAVPTIAPISVSLTVQLNVRSAPNVDAASIGLLNFGATVQIIGKDTSGAWWQIVYPENTATTGWIAAAYVKIPEADAARVPIVLTVAENSSTEPAINDTNQPVTSLGTPTVTAQNTARVTKEMFVRLGPAQTFETQGTVTAGTILTLTGRSQNNVWVQIIYESGASGKGWVAAAYLENANYAGLPYFDNQGVQIGAETPVVDPGNPTLTATAFSPAAADGDSEGKPSVRLSFSPDSSKEFMYSSDLSSPNGDTIDWVAFTPYDPANATTYVYLQLECSGNGGVTATLEKDGYPVPETKKLVCGNYDFALKLLSGQEYILVLAADGSGGPLRYVRYTLYISSEQ